MSNRIIAAWLLALLAVMTAGCSGSNLDYNWCLNCWDNNPAAPWNYADLAGKSVAVLVATDEDFDPQNLGLRQDLCVAVTGALSAKIPDATFLEPQEVSKFTQTHPDWSPRDPGQLLAALKVQRLVYIDVNDLRTPAKSSQSDLPVTMIATVSVAAHDAFKSHSFCMSAWVLSELPMADPQTQPTESDAVLTKRLFQRFADQISEHFMPKPR